MVYCAECSDKCGAGICEQTSGACGILGTYSK